MNSNLKKRRQMQFYWLKTENRMELDILIGHNSEVGVASQFTQQDIGLCAFGTFLVVKCPVNVGTVKPV